METITLNAVTAKTTTGRLAALFVISFLSCAFGGAVSTMMSAYLPAVISELKVSQSAGRLADIGAYINSVFIFGWAAGGFLWGFVSDKIGRKNAILLAVLNYGAFTILTGVMPGWGAVVACRFISGFGVGGMMVVLFTLLAEAWPAKTREVAIGIISISFPVGIFCAGLISYFITSWREAFFIGIIPAILAIAGYWLLDESSPWLQHRSATKNGSTLKESLLSGQNLKSLISGSVIFGSMLIGLWAIFSWLPTWIQTFFAANARQQGGLSIMFLGMGGLIGGFFSGWMMKVMGLRASLITCFVVCTIAAFMLFKTNSTFSNAVYYEIALLALFFGASQGILSIYIPLMFATNVRASATGICFNAGRLLTGTAVLFVGVLVTSLGGYGNALFIFSFVFVIGLLAVLFFKNSLKQD
jgi:MFS family permease